MSPTAKASGWPGIERSGATSTRPERSSSIPSVRPLGAVLLALGGLERQEHAAADLERVFQGFEPRRQHFPLIVAEVRVAGARREDERVVADVASIEH